MTSQRYLKQTLFAPIGVAGQTAIRSTRVLLVGCGALGSVIAEQLTRAGIGSLRIVDRDYVDLSNLQRQQLYTEQDVSAHLPKAIAAQNRLREINSEVEIAAHVSDLNSNNIRELAANCQLILDGTDNFETRYLINDLALETNIPWISGGVLGSTGQVFLVAPRQTACLRCLVPEPPPQPETCDTAGVLGPAVNVVASLQVARALQFITCPNSPNPFLTRVDVWNGEFQQIDLTPLRQEAQCPACDQGERLWLSGKQGSRSLILCGRGAVQISPATPLKLSLSDLEKQWSTLGETRLNPFLLWFSPADQAPLELHLFADGRAIIKGTEDLSVAKTVYHRFIGA